MAILNLTPDSFYDGKSNIDGPFLIEKLNQFKHAEIIDVGGESTRPFSKSISLKEEINRLSMFIDIKNNTEKLLSIDSYKPEVIRYALDKGFHIINDITGGGKNNCNIRLAAEYNVPIIIMHMQGEPQNMQIKPKYNNIIDDIINFFENKINIMKNEFNLRNSHIILDPGIGFGKSIKDNYLIINNIHRFKKLGFSVIVGLSRKSFLSIDNDRPVDRKISSITAQNIAVLNGVNCIRTHDIKETYVSLRTLDRFKI